MASRTDRDICGLNPDKAEVHLPIGMKRDVHTMYMDEVRCGNEDLQPVSIKHFNFV